MNIIFQIESSRVCVLFWNLEMTNVSNCWNLRAKPTKNTVNLWKLCNGMRRKTSNRRSLCEFCVLNWYGSLAVLLRPFLEWSFVELWFLNTETFLSTFLQTFFVRFLCLCYYALEIGFKTFKGNFLDVICVIFCDFEKSPTKESSLFWCMLEFVEYSADTKMLEIVCIYFLPSVFDIDTKSVMINKWLLNSNRNIILQNFVI
jgi:hypothetical protein